ncbi:SUKH-4 family immunity protein [Kitasatospora sp. SolWspMP-SS2h]|uniref:SUKH-4 family immunity protein n=1 Tax=Kitasatospora sp. SolWspMP-SS2h TaxID=1305729 RepID=UPI001F3B4F27|nr:SUKH-4 family immunity protein [Kitasatospora sp. SolWspMP-SS2h]
MTTYAQAQETAEDWINAGVPRSRHREVKVREFDLGYVCWAVDGSEHGGGPGTSLRLVIARDSGASTLWPPLPVNEVVRQYEELYGTGAEPNPAGAAKPVRGAVEATSFLLSPPQWLQEAGAAAIAAEADRLAAPAPAAPAIPPQAAAPAPRPLPPPVPQAASLPEPGEEGPSYFTGTPTPVPGTPVPPPPGSEAATVLAPGRAFPGTAPGVPVPPGATPPYPGPGAPVPPAAPPYPAGGPGTPAPGTPVPPPPGAPVPPVPGAPAPSASPVDHAATVLATDGPPGLMGLPGAPGPGAPLPGPGVQLGRGGPGAPPPPPPNELLPSTGGPAPRPGGRGGPGAPPPPPPSDLLSAAGGPARHPGGPGGRGGAGAPPPPAPDGLRAEGAPPAGPTAHAVPGAPAAPAPEAAAVAHQATQLAPAIELPPGVTPPFPGAPQQPPFQAPPPPFQAPPPPFPGGPQGHGLPPGAPGAPGQAPPPAGPVPPPSGLPTVGPGTTAVVNYRAPDGSELSLVMTSELGTPHPEWRALQELRRLGVPADQVLEVHTELELCDLPSGYCSRMVRASWPNARISHTAPYGRDAAARQAGMNVLQEHVEQLHQLVSAPHRPRTVRAPLPAPGAVPQLPPPPPQQLAAEFGAMFGPSMFRFEQRAVARQGVPEQVAQILMWVGLPREFTPFFWAQAQEGRPIPTLAELAAERGLPPGPDFGGYLVLGNDYGRQLCVQYGTAAVVAVDVENPAEPPRFVNSGVPEFAACLAALARMWHLRHGLNPEQAGRWTTDFQAQLLAVDPAAVHTPESWWAVLVEQLWDGLL